MRSRAFAPLPIRAVEDAAPENADILPFGQNAAFHHSAAGQIERLVVGERDLAGAMNARAKVKQVWSSLARARGMIFDSVGKQQQGAFLAVGLDAQFAWARKRDDCRVRVGQPSLDSRVRRADHQVGERLFGPEANFDRAGHIKTGKRVRPAIVIFFARKRRVEHARGVNGHRMPSGLDFVLGREGFAGWRRIGDDLRGTLEIGCEQARQHEAESDSRGQG